MGTKLETVKRTTQGTVYGVLFGWLADRTSIELVFRICTLLPLIGIVAAFLPNVPVKRVAEKVE